MIIEEIIKLFFRILNYLKSSYILIIVLLTNSGLVMSKKISREITQGLLKSRMTEKQVDRSIKKLQKSQKKLLLEIKGMIDSHNIEEARLLARELVYSRSSIKQLGKLKFYVRGIQFFFKNAQTQMLKGETLDNIAEVLTKVNRIMSVETLDQTFMAIENEMEGLNLNLEEASEALEFLDEPIDEDEFVDEIITELQSVKKEDAIPKINELVSLKKLLPAIPKFDAELRQDDDAEELED